MQRTFLLTLTQLSVDFVYNLDDADVTVTRVLPDPKHSSHATSDTTADNVDTAWPSRRLVTLNLSESACTFSFYMGEHGRDLTSGIQITLTPRRAHMSDVAPASIHAENLHTRPSSATSDGVAQGGQSSFSRDWDAQPRNKHSSTFLDLPPQDLLRQESSAPPRFVVTIPKHACAMIYTMSQPDTCICSVRTQANLDDIIELHQLVTSRRCNGDALTSSPLHLITWQSDLHMHVISYLIQAQAMNLAHTFTWACHHLMAVATIRSLEIQQPTKRIYSCKMSGDHLSTFPKAKRVHHGSWFT